MIPRIYSQDHPGRLWQTLGTSVTYIYIYDFTIHSVGHSYRRAFSTNFRHIFRAIFQSSIFSWVFFSNYWNVNELDFFASSGEFHE